MENICNMFSIDEKMFKLTDNIENEKKDIYNNISNIALINQAKVLKAFQNNHVSQMHFGKTTGYGYSDVGREVIEKIYAEIFNAEDSLVRIQFVNGTHAISVALQALLMPGDKLLAISGKPYDTLCEVIGITKNSLSLKSYGVEYDQIDLLDNGDFDFKKIKEYLNCNKVKVIHVQRSKGYSTRKSLFIEDIEKVVKLIKNIDNNIIIMVDNCYGEFVEELEPTDVGTDICVGSLIKNIGGGLCEMGGYIVGKHDLIELCAQKLTCPGIGKECGATLGQNRNILQGLFMAPATVKNAMHTAIFTSALMQKLGYEVYPTCDEKRSDIIQAIKFCDENKLVKFIQGIQMASPVDSNVTPFPWDMPGYEDPVIMAAGTFIEGASIELSADSPIRAPYVAYIQGGITYESAKLAVLIATSKILEDN